MAQQQAGPTIKPQGQVRSAASGRLDRGDTALRLEAADGALVRQHMDPASGWEPARLAIRERVSVEAVDIEFHYGEERSGTGLLHLADLPGGLSALLGFGGEDRTAGAFGG